MDALTIILVLVYFIVLLIIGYIASKKENEEGFLIANRRVKWYLLMATLAGGYFGGGALVLLASWAFKYGLSVLWVFAGAVLGFILLIVISRKLKPMADKNKFYTISDYIYKIFDKKTGLLGTVSIFFYFFGWLMLQFIGGGIILASLLGINYIYAVLIVGLIILIYLMLAGFEAVIKTDFFQYLIMLILGLFVLKLSLGATTFSLEQLNIFKGVGGAAGAIGFLIIGMMITVLSGDMWQRIYSAKNKKNLNMGLVGAAISVIIIGVAISSIGFWANSNFPNILAGDAFVYGIQNLLPASLLGIGLLIILSSIMSTADTILFAMSMNLSRDILSHFNRLSRETLVKYTRISIFILTAVAILISSLTRDVANFGLITASIILPLGPSIISSFFMKIKKNAAFISILLGLLTVIILIITGNLNDTTTVVPFIISLITIIPLQIVLQGD